MAIEHQRGPIGHKRYGVANWPQLGSRLEFPQDAWRTVNLCGCDSLADQVTVNVTSLLEPRLRFATQASPKSNTKHHVNSNLRGTVGLKDSD
ncbi:hypothetical protein O181_086641 [Austropuccinia psidii MF-1]|uniref:Uncharacterized protein n=1 Tax=Austropuccinia psidii MF-1 TaxID=1389203 RepID=A0A9Q3IKV5_9BASI|nr:hypothetical protein [Austropuccinia psidii MF-1]